MIKESIKNISLVEIRAQGRDYGVEGSVKTLQQSW